MDIGHHNYDFGHAAAAPGYSNVFLTELSKNAAGKILKRELRKHGELERGVDSRTNENPS